MTTHILKTVRLSAELAASVEKESAALGLTFNDYAAHALRLALTGKRDATIPFLKALAAWTRKRHAGQDFPQDVTLTVFHHIRDTRAVRRAYDRLTTDAAGRKDREAVWSLHRRIGLLVKRVLNAEVMGRSLPHDPAEHLVTTFSLLGPSASTEKEA